MVVNLKVQTVHNINPKNNVLSLFLINLVIGIQKPIHAKLGLAKMLLILLSLLHYVNNTIPSVILIISIVDNKNALIYHIKQMKNVKNIIQIAHLMDKLALIENSVLMYMS